MYESSSNDLCEHASHHRALAQVGRAHNESIDVAGFVARGQKTQSLRADRIGADYQLVLRAQATSPNRIQRLSGQPGVAPKRKDADGHQRLAEWTIHRSLQLSGHRLKPRLVRSCMFNWDTVGTGVGVPLDHDPDSINFAPEDNRIDARPLHRPAVSTGKLLVAHIQFSIV